MAQIRQCPGSNVAKIREHSCQTCSKYLVNLPLRSLARIINNSWPWQTMLDRLMGGRNLVQWADTGVAFSWGDHSTVWSVWVLIIHQGHFTGEMDTDITFCRAIRNIVTLRLSLWHFQEITHTVWMSVHGPEWNVSYVEIDVYV